MDIAENQGANFAKLLLTFEKGQSIVAKEEKKSSPVTENDNTKESTANGEVSSAQPVTENDTTKESTTNDQVSSAQPENKPKAKKEREEPKTEKKNKCFCM